jgi:F420-non-reducing hydrogenase large subunit
MNRTITIDPVTRIEGHARIILNLNDDGHFESLRLIVNELRGFERILVGMEATQMPMITARICGVCPSAHHLAATNAIEAAAEVQVPPAATLLRELLYMGHIIHSHALSLFVLQGPDLVLGIDSDAAQRNIIGMLNALPEVVKKAIRLRTLGQRINELVGGRGTHPVTSVLGGVTFKLDQEKHKLLTLWADELLMLVQALGPVAVSCVEKQMERNLFGLKEWNTPFWKMGTVKQGVLKFIEGNLRIVDEAGTIKRELPTKEYDQYLKEKTFDWSYMKPVEILLDDIKHPYMVGPLARINVADSISTPLAQAELEKFRSLLGRTCHVTLMQAYARVIELLHAIERVKEIITDKEIWGEARVPVRFKAARGAGHVEAPRGTLIHDYEIDEHGIVRAANLIVATQQNYLAMNKTLEQAAEALFKTNGNDENLLNVLEFGMRCYDPCLSCATHAVGAMPMELTMSCEGEILRTIRRDGR